MLFTGALSGATLTWDGSYGNWDTDTSWLPGVTEPTSSDDANIYAGTVVVTMPGELADQISLGNGTLNIEAGGSVSNSIGYIGFDASSTGIATVTGPGSVWNNSSSLYVGHSGNGTLNIEAGGSASNSIGYLGFDASSTGIATVTGPGSIWTNSTALYVGKAGNGTLNVEAGGSVSNHVGFIGHDANSMGVATVTGPGSIWTNSSDLYVGRFGNGTLNVEAGGSVSNHVGYLGYDANTTGVATITGPGSIWTNVSTMYVGRFGNGTLNVENGGVVSNRDSHIGYGINSTGVATVTGPGSIWTNVITLYVGNAGNGTLNVENGGAVSNRDGHIGYGINSTGVATVTGTDSTWTNFGNLYAGYTGNGTLNVEAGGAVSSNAGYIGYFAVSTGVATVTGADSTWTNLSDLYVGYTGNGVLNVEAGGSVSNSNGYIGYVGNPGSPTGVATVTGPGSTWVNSDSLYVGNSGDGTLNIENAGVVHVMQDTLVGIDGNGTINFAGGTLNTAVLFASPEDLLGVGTINTKGLVVDMDLTFDATSGPQQQIILNNLPGQNVTINLNASDTVNPGSMGVGYRGAGTLTITDGTSVYSETGYLGYKPGANGVATVAGAGSTWTNSGSLHVGWYGEGTLNIENGGVVHTMHDTRIGVYDSGSGRIHFAGGTLNTRGLFASPSELLGAGTINTNGLVSDIDLTFDANTGLQQQHILNSLPGQNVTINLDVSSPTDPGALGVGYLGAGTLTITDGLSVFSEHGYLGFYAGSTGVATVTGSGSAWTNSGSLVVGYSGTGTLDVEAGGSVSNLIASIGLDAGSTGIVTVTGEGTTWDSSMALNVNNGAMRIEAGGLMSTGVTEIGSSFGMTGEVTVTGAGSSWNNSGYLRIGSTNFGSGGDGTLNIQDGGSVMSDNYIRIGFGSSSRGIATVTGAGSTLKTLDDLIVSGSYYHGDGSGILSVVDGGQVIVANTLFVNRGGSIRGNSDITATILSNAGTVAPGNRSATLSLTGHYTQEPDGTLEIELAGVLDHDVLDVTGDVILDGTLDIKMLDGYVPIIGDSFDILTFNSSLTGVFSDIQFPTLPGIGLFVSYSSSSVTLTAGLLGDLNGDGLVGIEDLNAVLSGWDQSVVAGNLLAGDPSGDGFVGIEDLNMVLGNWDAGTPPPEALALVPEPASSAVIMLGVIAGTLSRKRG